LRHEAEIEGVLLVEHRQQPVFERISAAGADPVLVRQHLLPAGAHGFRNAPSLKQPPVERRQEHLCAAHIERIGHRDHAAHAALQQCRGHRGEGVAGLGVQHSGLAGVQHHGGDGVFVQQGAQVAGGFRIGIAVCVLEDQAALRTLQHVRRVLARAFAIRAVTVEVERVIVAGVGAKVLAKLIESRWAQHIRVCWQAARLDEFYKRPRDGAVADVGFVRPRDHQQDIDAILGKRAARRRIGKVIQAALDLTLMRNVTALRIEERFPRPGEDMRVVAADLQNFGFRQPLARVAAVEEGVEGLRAPGFEGVQDAPGVADFGIEGVVEEVLQIPAQLLHQVGVRLAFDRKGVRRRYRYRSRKLTVT
jgi:hypothetical protein